MYIIVNIPNFDQGNFLSSYALRKDAQQIDRLTKLKRLVGNKKTCQAELSFICTFFNVKYKDLSETINPYSNQ